MQTSILSTIASIISSRIGASLDESISNLLHLSLGRDLNMKIFQSEKRYPYSTATHNLKNLRVQTSTYGKAIPTVYGATRISGNIIWALPIKYTQHQTVSISNPTPDTHITSTGKYHATLAIALCQGVVHRVSKIWANGRPLNLRDIKYTLYKGTEDQEPDPLILSTEGTAPAYRGLSYIVLQNIPIHDYGNTIPNFVFEVTSYPNAFLHSHVTQRITCIHTACPAEFACDTEVQVVIPEANIERYSIAYGTAYKINGDVGSTKSHAILALEHLKDVLPNLQWIAMTVYWFADNASVKNCNVYPAVTPVARKHTSPEEWRVAAVTKYAAKAVSESITSTGYGGTVNDASLVRYINELKSRGYKILLCPQLILDTKNSAASLHGKPQDIMEFFRNHYNPFIHHYCQLLKGLVDAFVVGTRLDGLTKVTSDGKYFPAVEALIQLAKHVKDFLGREVITTYAANWHEYHSHDKLYNLDALWSSDYIDIVGISAYFPLTDIPQPTYGFTEQDIVKSWNSGEGYSYFYPNNDKGKKTAYDSSDVSFKNIFHWWNSSHIDKNGYQSPWKPKMKKIWFIEYGFRSIDNCTSGPQPPQPTSSENTLLPPFSRGNVDFAAQKNAIEATLTNWQSSEMVERMFLQKWDIRPHTPSTKSSEYHHWQTSHSIEGKITSIPLCAVIEDLLKKAGMTQDFRIEGLNEPLAGYVVHHREPVMRAIETLKAVYLFNIKEVDGTLVFSHSNSNAIQVPESDIILNHEGSAASITLPTHNTIKLEFLYISRNANYQLKLKDSQTLNDHSGVSKILQVPLVLEDPHAKHITDSLFSNIISKTYHFSFVLPIRYIFLNIGDVLTIQYKGSPYNLRITSIQLDNMLMRIEGQGCSPTPINNGSFPPL